MNAEIFKMSIAETALYAYLSGKMPFNLVNDSAKEIATYFEDNLDGEPVNYRSFSDDSVAYFYLNSKEIHVFNDFSSVFKQVNEYTKPK